MARFTPKLFRRKLAGLSFRVLLICLLLSTAITFAMCAGYVDGELLLRQHSLRNTALDLYQEAGLTAQEVAGLLTSADYLIRSQDPAQLTPQQLEDAQAGLPVVAGGFMNRVLYFFLGGQLMAVEAYPAANLIVSTVLRSLLGNLIVIVLGFVAVYTLSRQLALPLVHLTRATRQIAKGNFDIQVRLPQSRLGSGIREIAQLADDFNRMAHELKSVEYLRRDFTSNLSHELKSPVASIRGYARLLQMEGLSPEQRQEYVSAIAAESQRLGSLSDNLLRLTRLEGQAPKLALEKFCLDEQLRRCVTSLYPQIQKKSQSIQADLPRVLILADQELLNQVWQNLLDNAIKFSPQGGRLSLSLSKPNRAQIQVRVCDDGPGMDEVTCQRIFEKFFQGDPSRHMGGNGLGLPLVKRILDLCGGSIQVESQPCQGACFTVTLPLNPTP